MRLVLQRTPELGGAVIGTVWIAGVRTFFSLENASCLIPAGIYPLTLYYSVKNKRIVPLLHDVPGRTYIEIHPANFPRELAGCIAMGLGRNVAALESSVVAIEALNKMIKPQLTVGNRCDIEIRDVVPNEVLVV